MPRGRAGLALVTPDEVRAAFTKHYGIGGYFIPNRDRIAADWQVNERTVRRWMATGLPLHYGNVYVRREEWAEFVRTGKSPRAPIARDLKRTGVDRQLSAPAGRPGTRTGVRDRRNLSATSTSSRTRVGRNRVAR